MKAFRRWIKSLALAVIVLAGLISTSATAVEAEQSDLFWPGGSDDFGWDVAVLPNGNLVVVDPYFDAGSVDVGAAHLCGGASR